MNEVNNKLREDFQGFAGAKPLYAYG